MGHQRQSQTNFDIKKWNLKESHGGVLRRLRRGRGSRPLSSRDPLHIVFKVDRRRLRTRSLRTHRNFQMIMDIHRQYGRRFFVKIEQISVQGDHIHVLIRATKRTQALNFFRVVSGQIAQRFELTDKLLPGAVTDTQAGKRRRGVALWRYRPFTRLVKGWRSYRTVRNYIQLNEKEALGDIPYRKERLRGLSMQDWKILWS